MTADEGRPPAARRPDEHRADPGLTARRQEALARLQRAHHAAVCTPERRCPEHRVDVDPEPVGQLLIRLFDAPETPAPPRRG